ncbi:hypothetical protein [Maribacter halichondriae]|uniref:hypothetical protein n=1 Tax=Maribacter halichondriae TaxID=2980554 RepID=UPI00235A2D25|nr:hypothetical protein [Maribacter sp. Hal144]
MIETVLEALQELKTEAKDISDSHSLTNWKNKAINLIVRIYGADSKPENQIKELKYISYLGGERIFYQAIQIL